LRHTRRRRAAARRGVPPRPGVPDAGLGSTGRTKILSTHDELRKAVETAYESRTQLKAGNAPAELRSAVENAIELLNQGQLRVAEPHGGGWRVNEWLKKAVLLSFRINDNESAAA